MGNDISVVVKVIINVMMIHEAERKREPDSSNENAHRKHLPHRKHTLL